MLASGSPASRGYTGGAALSPAGRAARCEADLAGDAGEIWRLAGDAERAAARLAELGRCGAGGFIAAGRDEDGVWLARLAPAATLSAWLEQHPGPADPALACSLAASLADAAAACEAVSLFPGAIDPDGVFVRGDSLEIRADAMVGALVGGGGVVASPGAARWLSPEQAEGQPADSASNRYAIGLLLYRLLSGEHPFSGRGLRRGLDDQLQRGAPPLPDAIAASLPPGLHGACLRLLDPDPSRRPASAAEIAAQLGGFAGGRSPASSPGTSPAPMRSASPITSPSSIAPPSPIAPPSSITSPSSIAPPSPIAPPSSITSPSSIASPSPITPPSPASSRLPHPRLLAGLAVVAAGAIAAWCAIRAVSPATASAARAHPRRPLTEPRALADCASCHPRQSAEWSRSVMAHAADSPLFEALEMLIQEQVGRERDCPGGAGILRRAGAGACRSRATGLPVTGSGGELWCVNCHTPGQNLGASMPAWNGRAALDASRRPLRDLLPAASMEGISCAACHQTTGPAHPGNGAAGRYEGNPSWLSPDTGRRFSMRPEDERGLFGISNSGYFLEPSALLGRPGAALVRGDAHAQASPGARRYLASSEFCGACHDVRLFGTDALTGARRGEHFKRLRNAYSEWAAWSEGELRAGRQAASCQDCHMSQYPGVCVPGAARPADGATAAARACPQGTVFEPRPPGSYARGRAAAGSADGRVTAHYFSGVDLPLTAGFDRAAIADPTLDVAGIPLGASQRRDLLLARTFRLALDRPTLRSGRLEIPIEVENVGAGHRVPAGFSQEREFWIHLRVTDARGRVVYEVGNVERGDEDLRDKVFLRVNSADDATDGLGRPLGLFGADVADGPDVPRWDPPPSHGGTRFRGRGLINFQNGFLRCVQCVGTIDGSGRCQAAPGQEGRRAARYADAPYDPDTGTCSSNLRGLDAFFETYFPIGALDATRGLVKGPDAIIDTRSVPPGEPVRYVYDLDVAGGGGPLVIEARLMFRAFPPFLVRAFIDYEARQQARGLRPSGPLVDASALERLELVEIAVARARVE